MLFIKENGEPLWGKYTADTINIGGNYVNIPIGEEDDAVGMDENSIDDWVWSQMTKEAKATLERKSANGRYRRCG